MKVQFIEETNLLAKVGKDIERLIRSNLHFDDKISLLLTSKKAAKSIPFERGLQVKHRLTKATDNQPAPFHQIEGVIEYSEWCNNAMKELSHAMDFMKYLDIKMKILLVLMICKCIKKMVFLFNKSNVFYYKFSQQRQKRLNKFRRY